MGYLPTHGPDCYKVHSFATTCRDCHAVVIYFECSCGSKVFLDPPDYGQHSCGKPIKRAERANLLITLIEYAQQNINDTTECPMCGVKVKNKTVRKHFKKCPKRKLWFPLP